MGVAVSAIPLAGCDLINFDGSSSDTAPSSITASADEVAAYEVAKSQSTVVAVEEFLRKYPDSQLIRSLLQDQSPSTLRRINDNVVRKLSPTVVSSLSPGVKQALGVEAERGESDGGSGASDGYSG